MEGRHKRLVKQTEWWVCVWRKGEKRAGVVLQAVVEGGSRKKRQGVCERKWADVGVRMRKGRKQREGESRGTGVEGESREKGKKGKRERRWDGCGGEGVVWEPVCVGPAQKNPPVTSLSNYRVCLAALLLLRNVFVFMPLFIMVAQRCKNSRLGEGRLWKGVGKEPQLYIYTLLLFPPNDDSLMFLYLKMALDFSQ